MDSSSEVFDLKRQPIRTTRSTLLVNNTSGSSEFENAISETVYTSETIIKRSDRVRHNTSDYSSEDDVAGVANNKSAKNGDAVKPIDLSEHQAYKLYKEAGEYWNKYPKTDYTYSKYSPHRREIAPGVIAMPNMSRRSIRRDDANYLSSTENYVNTIRSQRFYVDGETPKLAWRNHWRRDTVDRYHIQQETFIQKILRVTRITLIFTTIANFLTSFRQQSIYKQRWYHKLWNNIVQTVHLLGSTYYTLLGYVLLTDTWLLTRNPRSKDMSQGRYLFYILLIVLIPLLLLFGWWLYSDNDEGIVTTSLTKLHQVTTNVLEAVVAMSTGIFTSVFNLPLLWFNSSHPVQNEPISVDHIAVKSDPAWIKIESLQDKIIQQPAEVPPSTPIHTETVQTIETTTAISEDEIKSMIANQIKDIRQDLENHKKFLIDLILQLNQLKESQDANLNQKIEQIKYEISNYVHVEIQKILTTQQVQSKTVDSDELMKFKYELRKLQDALKIYDADKTGLPDFALESSGGQIISTRCTESYNAKTSVISVFGVPLWYPSNSPRVVITQGVVPGECWAFQGFPGFLVIKLSAKIIITKFTLEHIPKIISPTGNIDSAPKNFSVWGLHNETELNPLKLGQYVYEDNGEPLQQFPVQIDNPPPFDMVELRVESNHGNIKFTCLYRFRVHGSIVNDIPPPS